MTLINSLGKLLKYELHHLWGNETSVMVVVTAQEWADFQKAAEEEHAAAPSDLTKLATDAVAAANVVKSPDGKVSVQFKAGDYPALATAHAAAAPPPEKPVETAATSNAADPRDARIAELEAKLAEKDKGGSETEATTKATPSPNETIA